jgi:hypothetical protein
MYVIGIFFICCLPLAPVIAAVTGLIVSAFFKQFSKRSITLKELFKYSFGGGLIFGIFAAILGFLMSFAIFGGKEFTEKCSMGSCIDEAAEAFGLMMIYLSTAGAFLLIGMIIGEIVACKCYLKILDREMFYTHLFYKQPFHRRLFYKQLFYKQLFQVFLLPFLLVFILDILRLSDQIRFHPFS